MPGDPDAQATRSAVWSRHWAHGATHSCAGSYGNTYGGAIAAFWRGVHDETPAGSRLLDIATGSGAIPRLWRSWRSVDRWDAVDLAEVAPGWAREAGDALRFHAGVRAEALPFPDTSFDLVASQYGIEYADLALAVPELLRVRRPQGRVALVLHHAASRPVTLARTELSHLAWALGPDGLVGACAGMLAPLVTATTAEGRARLARDPTAEAARLRFNAAQTALRERARIADGADVLGEIQDAVGRVLETALRAGEAPARSALQGLTQDLSDHQWRLRELSEHALDEGGLQALADQLTSAGLQTQVGTLSEGPHLMGWTLRARPSGTTRAAPARGPLPAAAPAVPGELRDLAAQLDRAGRHADAAAVYERLVALQPQWLDGWYNLGQAQWRARRFEAALLSYQRALDGGIRMPEELHLNRAVILAANLNQPDAALRELEQALTLNPRYIPALLNLGNLYEQRGDRDRARHWYDRVLDVDPRHALALSRQADLHTLLDPRDPLIARLEAAIREPGRTDEELADLGFGLGKALDEVGDYDAAFGAYTAANEASRRAVGPGRRYVGTDQAARIDRLIARFPAPPVATPAVSEPPPIFICGMFRSGSTLIEQVLAAHRRVTAGGELDLLPALANEYLPPDGDGPVPGDPGTLAAMARSYLGAVQQRFPGADIVTDKRPDNFLHIGLIKTLFPSARIVFTRRHPLDNCLSLYFLHLGHRMPYALDLRDTAHWYRQHERLMRHWHALFGRDIHTVDYDRFVVDPEFETRRLLDFCGLDWDPACLDFHRAAQRVQTASLWQVRRPLYRHASGRWQHYARHLDGLREALDLPSP